MADDVRLYVLAEFDARTEQRLSNYRDMMIVAGYVGMQTVGIKNHITLGSYPLECTETLTKQVERERGGKAIPVRFANIGNFGDRVLFISFEEDETLRALHERFDDGEHWVPHATMYLTEEGGIAPAKEYLESVFTPFEGEITRLALYEFFPSKLIVSVDFESRDT